MARNMAYKVLLLRKLYYCAEVEAKSEEEAITKANEGDWLTEPVEDDEAEDYLEFVEFLEEDNL